MTHTRLVTRSTLDPNDPPGPPGGSFGYLPPTRPEGRNCSGFQRVPALRNPEQLRVQRVPARWPDVSGQNTVRRTVPDAGIQVVGTASKANDFAVINGLMSIYGP